MTLQAHSYGNIAENNFSRHADLYDEYAGIQCLAAKELINKAAKRKVESILDIGCGTGNYTLLLRKEFEHAHIEAVDISHSMIEIARRKFPDGGIQFIVGDAEERAFVRKFDLITSNATLQWFNDLGLALESHKNALTEKGSVLFSIFGSLTFRELSLSVKEAMGKDVHISSDGFPDEKELASMMRTRFGKSDVKETLIKRRYDSLSELLRHIKYTGVRGGQVNGSSLWTRTMLRRIEEAYMANFGRIEASYQIFYCEGS
jgi:malonyl-CoA O-methyltransferase